MVQEDACIQKDVKIPFFIEIYAQIDVIITNCHFIMKPLNLKVFFTFYHQACTRYGKGVPVQGIGTEIVGLIIRMVRQFMCGTSQKTGDACVLDQLTIRKQELAPDGTRQRR